MGSTTASEGGFGAPSWQSPLAEARARNPVPLIATVAVGIAGGIFPFVNLAVMNDLAGVAIATLAALVALLGAYLMLGRFKRSGARSDLLIACSLALLGGGNLVFESILVIVTDGDAEGIGMWPGTISALMGAATMTAAAWSPHEHTDDPDRAARAGLLSVAAILAGVGVVSLLAGPRAGAAGGDPLLLGVQVVGATFLGAAAIGFFRRADNDNDVFERWLEASCILLAFARLNSVLYPVQDPAWLYGGDVLRLVAYVLLAAGAAREISTYWQRVAASAHLEERRRLARDMHDGLAQELAYISRQAQVLRHVVGPLPEVDRIGDSTTRALQEARRAIEALADTSEQPLELALEAEVTDVAARSGATVLMNLAQGLQISPAAREGLLRIAREAATNAIAHGRASRLTVDLHRGHGVSLRLADNGTGFDPTDATGGFGLVSMKERAEALGGDLKVESRPGRGTTIEVTLP